MDWPPLPDYGCFVRWPVDGHGFIYPDDVPLVNRMIPSERVFCRFQFDGTYYHYRYGAYRFRLRPVMWLKVKTDGLDVDDRVEVTGNGMERERFTASIWGMYYVRRKGRMFYRLRNADGSEVQQLYLSDHLKLLDDKSRVREGNTTFPEPKWLGKKPLDEGPSMDSGLQANDEEESEPSEHSTGEQE